MTDEEAAEGLMQILMGSGWSEETRNWPVSNTVLRALIDKRFAETYHDGAYYQLRVTPAGLAFLESYKSKGGDR